MQNDKKQILFVAFLAFFSLVILFAQFFHQERTIHPMDNCPICVWQMNAIALASLYFLVLFLLFTVIRCIITTDHKTRLCYDFFCFSRRAPPWNR
jgi:hypothetical protein